MKLTTTILLCLFALNSMATDYYISSTGNDANAGTSTGAAWQTVSKLNSATLISGDRVYFKRGDTFYGTIVNNQNNITYGAYGTGNKPVLTGFTDVTSWVNVSGNIWESTALTTSLSYINMVTVNGVNTAMGRIPNTGLYIYESAFSNTSITSSSVNSATINWSGAQVIIRKNGWTTEKLQVTSHSGNTLTYAGGGAAGNPNHGFFIQNDARTLDTQNEWYFNPSTKKIRIYSTSAPTGVRVATLDNVLVSPNNKINITIQDLSLIGASGSVINQSNNCSGHVVSNCDVSFAGESGVFLNYGSKATVIDNTISNTNGPGIWFRPDTVIASRNTITNAGVFLGAALHPHAIMNQGKVSDIGYNVIKNVGRAGVEWNNGIGRVHHNLIDSFGLSGNDVGAIYLDAYRDGIRLIDSNIVLNGLGYTVGTPYESQAEGIYLDEQAENVIVKGNTLAGNGDFGIKLHMAHGVSIIENTAYNNGMGLWNTGAGIGFLDGYGNYLRNITVKRNVFVAKKLTQYALNYITRYNDINLIGTSDSNYFAKPIQDTKSFVLQPTIPGSQTETNLAGWKSASGQDAHSYTATKTVTHVDSLRFEYNASSSPKTVSLGQKYVDVKGTVYNGSITVPAWSSVVLLRDGALASVSPPTANSGGDKSITLPTSSVSLTGSATSAAGHTSTYLWTKVSGSGVQSISGNTTLNPTITGLTTAGNYVFNLKVTQDDAQTANSTVNITVIPAAYPPTVTTSGNQTIIVSTASVTSTATPFSGQTITSYSWTKISGTGTISSPSSQNTNLTGLSGTSVFRITVTQTDGQTAYSDLTIKVSVPPTVTTSGNQAISVSTATVNSYPAPANGQSITNFSWAQLSGTTASILTPTSQNTKITGLAIGTSVFRITVTQTDTQTNYADVTITVTVAPVAPTANAGIDQIITLPTTSKSLIGNSSNASGTTATYLWTKISGVGTQTISYSTSLNPTISGMTSVGDYVFRLTVSQSDGQTAFDEMKITVMPEPPAAPTANAGVDQIITLPTTSKSIIGTATNAAGTTATYSWGKVSGAGTQTITNGTTLSPTINGLSTAGDYIYRLTVTQSDSQVAIDDVKITVNPTPAAPTVEIIGGDRTIQLPKDSVHVSANVTSTGTISTQNWVKMAGGAATITPSGANVTISNLVEGAYTFRYAMTQTDTQGASADVNVTVLAAVTPPTPSSNKMKRNIKIKFKNLP